MPKKYEIIKNAKDDYTLKFKDKEFNFHTNVKLISEMQQVHKKARLELIRDLTKENMSYKDLTIEENKNGKTYFDNSNKVELENAYIEGAIAEFFDNVCREKFNYSLTELIMEMGLNEEETETFTSELVGALTGNIPSGK